RNGVLPWQIRELGAAMWEDEFIQVAGAWTHLTTADDPEDPATDQQVELFDSAVAALADEVGPIPLPPIAKSAATLTRPDLPRERGAALWAHEFIQVAGAWTRLTPADGPEDPATDQEVELFDSAVAALADEVGPIPLQHIANSAATLTRPDLHRDLVRVGIALY